MKFSTDYFLSLSLCIHLALYMIIMSKKDWIHVAPKMSINKLKQKLSGSRQISCLLLSRKGEQRGGRSKVSRLSAHLDLSFFQEVLFLSLHIRLDKYFISQEHCKINNEVIEYYDRENRGCQTILDKTELK